MTITLRVVLCTNAEVWESFAIDACNADWLDDSHEVAQQAFGRNARDYADRLIRAAASALPDDYETDSHFPNWDGGKYSHQARMFGWTPMDSAVAVYKVIEVGADEDGEEFSEVVECEAWTADHWDAIDAIENEIAKAVEAESADILHDYAGEIIQALAAELDELEELRDA